MKVLIISKKNPDWVLAGTLIKETDTKYFVWSNKSQTVEMHFPKDLYYMMNKTNKSNV